MSSRHFAQAHRIRFSECDPAGIVFYPQYFVLFNGLMEAWIDTLLPGGFAAFIARHRWGLPTVHLEADFQAVSRMGDDVILSLDVVRLGGSSMTLSLACTGTDGSPRMSVTQVVVATSLDSHSAIRIPEALRTALELPTQC